MRQIVAVGLLVFAASLLGGCAGGNLGGTSLLPSGAQSSVHRLDFGGGPVVSGHNGQAQPSDFGGGPVVSGRNGHAQPSDFGGGPVVSGHNAGGAPGTIGQ